MKSPLLGNQEPADCTPEQCGLAFAAEAQRVAQERDIPLTKAWQVVKVMHPEVHNRMIEARPVGADGVATVPPAMDAALANVYKEALADELAKNGGDIMAAHRAAAKRPALAGKLNWATLKNPFPVARINALPADPAKPFGATKALGNDATLAGAVALANSGGDFYFPKNYKPGDPFIMRLASPDCLA